MDYLRLSDSCNCPFLEMFASNIKTWESFIDAIWSINASSLCQCHVTSGLSQRLPRPACQFLGIWRASLATSFVPVNSDNYGNDQRRYLDPTMHGGHRGICLLVDLLFILSSYNQDKLRTKAMFRFEKKHYQKYRGCLLH